jgi:hypothetical protein
LSTAAADFVPTFEAHKLEKMRKKSSTSAKLFKNNAYERQVFADTKKAPEGAFVNHHFCTYRSSESTD